MSAKFVSFKQIIHSVVDLIGLIIKNSQVIGFWGAGHLNKATVHFQRPGQRQRFVQALPSPFIASGYVLLRAKRRSLVIP